MSKILLDYFFPITTIEPTPAASTAFLKQVAIVVNPNGGGSDGDITECTTYAQVQAITDNTEAEQLFNAGMSRVFVIQSDDLNLSSILNANLAEFFTLLISSDFAQADIVASQATLTLEEVLFTAVTAGRCFNCDSSCQCCQWGRRCIGSCNRFDYKWCHCSRRSR
jgi:hypothetical protein